MTAIPPTDSDPVVDAMTRVSLPQPVYTKGRSVMGVRVSPEGGARYRDRATGGR